MQGLGMKVSKVGWSEPLGLWVRMVEGALFVLEG